MSGPERVRLPSAMARPMHRLAEAGFEIHLVGRSAGQLLRGVAAPDYELATTAGQDALLALFPSAVPLTSRRTLLPTSAGAADLLSRPPSVGIVAWLGRRDFTLNALAVDAEGAVLDAYGGRADLHAGHLRCVGEARSRLDEDPLRALRAARLVATEGVEPDAELIAAMPAVAGRLLRRPAVSLRAEVCALMLGRHAGRGVALLRAGGLEAELAPGADPDAAEVVAALPRELELRLAGWLRGTRAVRCLRRLRMPRDRVLAVERLLQLHPLDAGATPLRRLLKRPPELVDRLFALRSAEIAVRGEAEGERLALEDLRRALEEARRGTGAGPLALDGRGVMEALGCGPGPQVGRALAFLRKAVDSDPACNTPDGLRALLQSRDGHPNQEETK